MDNNGHRCITGVIASPHGLMLGYKNDERLFREYGGMHFNFCPICGRPNKPVALHEQVRGLVSEYGTDAVMAAAGRL